MTEMIKGYLAALAALCLIAALAALIGLSNGEDREFAKAFEACKRAGETEYTCRAYVTSMKAKNAADFAAGLSAASIGVRAAR